MAEQSELPDWLKEMQSSQSAGGDTSSPFSDLREKAGALQPEEEEETAETAEGAPTELQASAAGGFSTLRRKASAMADLQEEEEAPLQGSPIFAIVRSLKPWQRFTLSLLLLMNISTLGCFILLVLQRIDPSKLSSLFGAR